MRKMFICLDYEGFTGTTTWEDVEIKSQAMIPFIAHSINEIHCVSDFAYENGYHQVCVKDAHDLGCNIQKHQLQEGIELISGWKNEPYLMFEGLNGDESGIVLLGFHCAANSNDTTLAHTLNPWLIKEMHINGELASEFLIHFHIANLLKIPILVATGDEVIGEQIKRISPQTEFVCEKNFDHGTIQHIQPESVLNQLQTALMIANEKEWQFEENPNQYVIQVRYHDTHMAHKNGFYPNAKQTDAYTVEYQSESYDAILRFILFTCL